MDTNTIGPNETLPYIRSINYSSNVDRDIILDLCNTLFAAVREQFPKGSDITVSMHRQEDGGVTPVTIKVWPSKAHTGAYRTLPTFRLRGINPKDQPRFVLNDRTAGLEEFTPRFVRGVESNTWTL